MKEKVATLVLILCFGTTAWCKDPDPKDFPITIAVTEVSSQQLPTDTQTRTQVHDPCIGMGANDPRRARVDCTPKSSTTTSGIGYTTVFALTARVGDKVYELQGPRLELGDYASRFERGHIIILAKNEKGKLVKVKYQIIGEHQS